MATARNNLIDLDSTAYYHVVNRCIRRAFIMGDDPVTGEIRQAGEIRQSLKYE